MGGGGEGGVEKMVSPPGAQRRRPRLAEQPRGDGAARGPHGRGGDAAAAVRREPEEEGQAQRPQRHQALQVEENARGGREQSQPPAQERGGGASNAVRGGRGRAGGAGGTGGEHEVAALPHRSGAPREGRAAGLRRHDPRRHRPLEGERAGRAGPDRAVRRQPPARELL
jgi:hypothetical protein